jgi:hypothetical protein
MGDVLIDLTGKRFGRWNVLNRAQNRGRALMWNCKCDCGTIKEVHGTSLKSGASKSCGCLLKEGKPRTHGLTKHPLYKVWQRMKGCTESPTHQDYKYYGALGVTVCEIWRKDFYEFYKWSINNGYKRGLTIDRINCEGDYEPNNCRWITIQEQQRNKRPRKVRYTK